MIGVALLVLLLSASAGGQDERRTQTPVRLCPVDEALADESLVRFREALRAAAGAYDVEALRPLVAEDAVGISLGDRNNAVVGFEAFTRYDAVGEPSGYYWFDFVGILQDGWVMEPGGTFCAPYYTCSAPPGWQRDEVLVRAYVTAYARPEPDSAEVARLSCDVLRIASGDDLAGIRLGPGWQAVHLPAGGVGFVANYEVTSPGLMARVGKRNGAWKVIELRSYQ